MLNIGGLHEGFVLDHIEAGKSMEIYKYLNLDKFDCCVAIIKNARSNKMGRKDIIKIECPIDQIDLDALGFIDHNITINIIKDDKIVEKKTLSLPKEIHNVVSCKNPRCISSIEQELEQVFVLTDPVKGIYRCKYCEEQYHRHRKLLNNKGRKHLLQRRCFLPLFMVFTAHIPANTELTYYFFQNFFIYSAAFSLLRLYFISI